jgi:hypothetical protein
MKYLLLATVLFSSGLMVDKCTYNAPKAGVDIPGVISVN